MCVRGASETQPLGRSMDRLRWSLGIRFFLRQALLDRLRGDPVSKGADLELVVAEDVGVVSVGEIGGEFANLVIDGLADCLGEVVDLVTSLRRRWGRRHGASIPKGVDFPSAAHFPCCVQKIHQLSRRPPPTARWYHPVRNSRSQVAIVEQAARTNQRSLINCKTIIQGDGPID